MYSLAISVRSVLAVYKARWYIALVPLSAAHPDIIGVSGIVGIIGGA